MKFRTLRQELKYDESNSLDFRDIRRILDQRGGKSHGLRAGYVDLESVHGKLTLERFLPKGHNACCVLLTAHLGGESPRSMLEERESMLAMALATHYRTTTRIAIR